MKKKRTYKPSPMAIEILQAVSMNLPAKTFLRGRSNHGGAEWALVALRKHGFLDAGGVTAEGYAAIARSRSNAGINGAAKASD
jgi:hypothetical protein